MDWESTRKVIPWVLGGMTFVGGVAGFGYLMETTMGRDRRVSKLREKGRKLGFSQPFLSLPEEQLRMAVVRPKFWEFKLLDAVLKSELDASSQLRTRLRAGDIVAEREEVSLEDFLHQISGRADALTSMVESAARLPVLLTEALAVPGQPGDPELIVEYGKRAGDLYRAAHEWSLAFNRYHVPDVCQHLRDLVMQLPSAIIMAVEGFADALARELEVMSGLPKRKLETEYEMKLVLNFALPKGLTEDILGEIQAVRRNALGG